LLLFYEFIFIIIVIINIYDFLIITIITL